MQSGKDNEIILLDWSGLAFGDYARVASRVKQIAKVVAANIGKLDNNNNNNVEWSSQLHVIGHSLGAQIAGFIGKYNVFQISRITGIYIVLFYTSNNIHNIIIYKLKYIQILSDYNY